VSINQKDIKLLWGRSGNRCAICKTELTQDKKTVTAAFTLGEQAHIVGEKEGAARGKSSLSQDERNTYHNLILLCPTHHTEIDNNETDWPIEKLHQVKSEHELWVMETLSETVDLYKLAQEAAVTNIIDSAVDLCDLENWSVWTSKALDIYPEWSSKQLYNAYEFRDKVIAAIWPEGFEDLKRSAITFSVLINAAAQEFRKHSRLSGDTYHAYQFYEKNGRWNDYYHEQLREYEDWLQECDRLIKEATKAVNWFADVIRRDINPMFFADKGKFIIADNYLCQMCLLEYDDQEKSQLPGALFKV